MKTCTKCRQEKPLSEFNKSKKETDGHQYLCRDCQHEYQVQYQRIYAGKQTHAKGNKKYYMTLVGKEVHAKANNKHKDKFPERVVAYNILNHAIEQGEITPKSCVICGSMENIQGHHEDYSQPLGVVWLCRGHHCKYHRKEKEFANVCEAC